MKHILITEDDRFLAGVYRTKFLAEGYEVSVVHDGAAAIEQLVVNPPHVVLLDLMLPEIDGLGVLRFLRARANLKSLPVLIASNSDYFSGEVQEALETGATHFLQKGKCSISEMVDKVIQIMPPHGVTNVNAKALPFIAAPAEAAHPGYTVPTHPIRVLIADDDKMIHGVLTFFMNQAGFIIRSAYDGRQALEMAIADAPDVLVLDMLMPHLNGNEVLQQWQQHPTLSKVPVIMLTSQKAEDNPAIALAGVAVKFRNKPFSPDQLVKDVNTFMGRNPD
ncbi:MAG: response regulator [Verrucomicrobiota bacterium]